MPEFKCCSKLQDPSLCQSWIITWPAHFLFDLSYKKYFLFLLQSAQTNKKMHLFCFKSAEIRLHLSGLHTSWSKAKGAINQLPKIGILFNPIRWHNQAQCLWFLPALWDLLQLSGLSERLWLHLELGLISESWHKVMFSICALWRFRLTIALSSVAERVR